VKRSRAIALVPFCLWLPRGSAGTDVPVPPEPASLQDAIRRHLVSLGHTGAEPLRWAITAIDPDRGLQLEGVAVCDAAAVRA
jgi:hypothetical protein